MENEKIRTKKILFKVFRFSPEKENYIFYDEYNLDVKKGMTVLDSLIQIKEEMDNTLSFRYSCRMGVCGSCGMFINGLPLLGCQKQVFDLKSDVIEVKPLPNYDTLRDIVSDLKPLFEKHRYVKPYIIRRDFEEFKNPTREYIQSPENLEKIFQFTYCIKCGLCLSACPTFASDDEFIGPQAIAQAYRYMIDARDDGFNERMNLIDNSHGTWRCHFGSSCSEVCPKGVDPAMGIQFLKREIILHALKIKKVKKPSPVAEPLKEAKRREGIPEPPPRTV